MGTIANVQADSRVERRWVHAQSAARNGGRDDICPFNRVRHQADSTREQFSQWKGNELPCLTVSCVTATNDSGAMAQSNGGKDWHWGFHEP